ncbi:hypothetical protein MtrunA17_Chr2g0329941 [Medicago truncatula]|uniref:Uncharacterized protein n=1 Tax=Medicago truncatula TaxID=3880 RepID=A0A396JIS3_MEDTR|nr:hypothetical protein MtrunA17_Chr2g0329941 [Medicago truncatula]
MEIVFRLGRQIIIYDQRHLLNINTTGQKVSGNENSRRARAEFTHDDITSVLVHVSMGG